MELHLKIPICFFDLETTGLQIAKDRIVEIALLKIMPNGERTSKEYRINPEIPIPPEVSQLHGIWDKDVAHKPTFKMIAKELEHFLEGCDLGGYNIVKFDLPLLVEEFLRVGIEFDYERKRIVDSQRIFYLMEKRTLAAAHRFYCNAELPNAHSAMADTKATFEVLLSQIKRYENQEVTDIHGNVISVIKNDVSALAKLNESDMVDLAGRMIKDSKGNVIFNFGKHKGKSVITVLKEEPSYYDWILKGDFANDTKRKLTAIRLKSLELLKK